MRDGTLTPHDVPEARAIHRRLCELQKRVAEVIDPGFTHAHDCFCGYSGFWPLRTERDFRNEGLAIDFIETAVMNALALEELLR